MKRFVIAVIGIAFLTGIFFFSVRPFEYDMWFNLKSGEIISKLGLIRYDVFSQATGREWYPSQWLFQLWMYWISVIGGLKLVQYTIAFLTVISVGLFALIARRIYRFAWPSVLLMSFIFYAVTFIYYESRSLTLVYILFLLTEYLILLYVKKRENYLWVTVPITILWTNVHGSMIFPAFLLGTYAAVCGIEWLKEKKVLLRKQTMTLAIWAVGSFLATLLPPVGVTQYKLLFLFFIKRDLITYYISEWRPLSKALTDYHLTIGLSATAAAFSGLAFIKRRDIHVQLRLFPLIPFVIASYLAQRNGFFGYAALGIIYLETIDSLWPAMKSVTERIVWFTAIAVLCGFSIWNLVARFHDPPLVIPDRAVAFIEKEHPIGRMYNEFGIGGYLIYHLYPQYKVFFDGRADIYLSQEIPDEFLLNNFNIPPVQYQKIVDGLMDKYHVAFAVISTGNGMSRRPVATVLAGEPDWHLVYWDDNFSIFVKDNTGNDALIKKWAARAATPLGSTPFVSGKSEDALREYTRMISFTDSANSRNGLAAIYFEKGDIVKTTEQLKLAAFVNKTYDATYVSLAGILIQQKQYDSAKDMLTLALRYNDQRGLTYLLLAQLYDKVYGNKNEAIATVRKGLSNAMDQSSIDQLKQELSSLTGNQNLKGL